MNDPILDYYKVSILPPLVRSFCFSNDAWIVGSGAKWLLNIKQDAPRDWDILVPFYAWGIACRSIPAGAVTNSNGGIKLQDHETFIDVWAGDIGWFLGQAPSPAYAVYPKTMTFLTASRELLRVKK